MIISEESEIFEEETENSKRTSVTELTDLQEKLQNSQTKPLNSPFDENFNIFKILPTTAANSSLKLSEQFSFPFELNPPNESTLTLSEQEKSLFSLINAKQQQQQEQQENCELEEQKRLLLESQNELYQLLFEQNIVKEEEEKSVEIPCRNSLKFFSFADQLPKQEEEGDTQQQKQEEEVEESQKESAKYQQKPEFTPYDSELQKQQLKISDLEASEETNEGIKTKKSEDSVQSLLHNDIFGQSSQNLLEHSKNYEILTLSDCNSLVTKKCFSLFLSNQENSILEEQEQLLEQQQYEQSPNKKLVQLKVYNENNQKQKHKCKTTKFINSQNLKLKCKLSLLPLVQKQKQQIEETQYSINNENVKLEKKQESLNCQHQYKHSLNNQVKKDEIHDQLINKKQKQTNFSSLKCMPKNYINFIEASIKNYDQKKTKNKGILNHSEIVFETSAKTQNKLKLKTFKQCIDNNKENQNQLNVVNSKKLNQMNRMQKKQINSQN